MQFVHSLAVKDSIKFYSLYSLADLRQITSSVDFCYKSYRNVSGLKKVSQWIRWIFCLSWSLAYWNHKMCVHMFTTTCAYRSFHGLSLTQNFSFPLLFHYHQAPSQIACSSLYLSHWICFRDSSDICSIWILELANLLLNIFAFPHSVFVIITIVIITIIISIACMAQGTNFLSPPSQSANY